MPTFEVEIMCTIAVTVPVVAEDADAALAQVERVDYPLPPQDAWQGLKDWKYRVYAPDGDILAEAG